MQISILGCGWLGLPLAKELAEGHIIKGSVTKPEKLQLLEAEGIQPYCIDLDKPNGPALDLFLKGSDALIISIPPKVRSEGNIRYAEKIENLLAHVVLAGIQNVLFTSSVSVYGDSVSVPCVDETTLPDPETESGRQVFAAEQVLQGCRQIKATIIRLGGLTGGERHPVYHLAGKQNIENPEGPVNLINRDQCLDIMARIIEKNAWGEIFTAVNPTTKTRKEYYTEKAAELGLPAPHFSDGIKKGKIVKGQEKLLSLLGFRF